MTKNFTTMSFFSLAFSITILAVVLANISFRVSDDCVKYGGWYSVDGKCFIEDKATGYTFELVKE